MLMLKTLVAYLLFRSVIQVSGTKCIIQLTSDMSLDTFFNVYSIKQLKVDYEQYTIGKAFKAFSADFDEDTLTDLYNNPKVAAISLDRTLELQEFIKQREAPKHLAKLSDEQTSSRRFQNTDNSFVFHSNAGNGVDVYIVDSGIDSHHPAFISRRIQKIADLTSKPIPIGDPHGHGTAMAGIIASEMFGVMKKANLLDLRVVGVKSNETNISQILRAFTIIEAHVKKTMRPSLVVLPFAMNKNTILNSAIENMPDQVPIIIPAGNNHQYSCIYSPMSARKTGNVLVVGSLDYSGETRVAEFSNYGDCVDVYTSGNQIDTLKSTGINSGGFITKISGTSMSCAIGAGVVGNYMSLGLNGTESLAKAKSSKLKNIHGDMIKELKLFLG